MIISATQDVAVFAPSGLTLKRLGVLGKGMGMIEEVEMVKADKKKPPFFSYSNLKERRSAFLNDWR